MINQLTKREIQIINLVASGLENWEIAKKLHISQNITNACVSRIYQKLDNKNKLNAAKK